MIGKKLILVGGHKWRILLTHQLAVVVVLIVRLEADYASSPLALERAGGSRKASDRLNPSHHWLQTRAE